VLASSWPTDAPAKSQPSVLQDDRLHLMQALTIVDRPSSNSSATEGTATSRSAVLLRLWYSFQNSICCFLPSTGRDHGQPEHLLLFTHLSRSFPDVLHAWCWHLHPPLTVLIVVYRNESPDSRALCATKWTTMRKSVARSPPNGAVLSSNACLLERTSISEQRPGKVCVMKGVFLDCWLTSPRL
jgi:hypothetical protein